MNDILQYIHVLAAITGVGVAFGFSILSRTAKSATEAKHTLHLFDKLGFVPHLGSIILLITSLIMVIMEPALFSKKWFIVSTFVYILVQGYVIGVLPKQMKALFAVLEAHTDDDIPESYRLISRKSVPIERTTQLLAAILLLLMIFKPM